MMLDSIRFARPNDHDAKQLLWVMDNTGLSKVWRTRHFSEEKILHILKQRISERRYIVYQRMENPFVLSRKIVGYVIFDAAKGRLSDLPEVFRKERHDDYAYCYGIGVHSDYRKRGIAGKLYLFALKEAKREGYLGLYADIDRGNSGSLNLHSKLDFHKVCTYKSKMRHMQSGYNVVYLKEF